MNPPQVSVITVQPERAPIVSELPGRVDAGCALRNCARVTGIVQKITFGAWRRQGKPTAVQDRSGVLGRHDRSHGATEAGAEPVQRCCWPTATPRW